MTSERPSFAIMGSGGIGGYFGARLAQAGFPVSLIARGEHLRKIREGGLLVDAPGETFRVTPFATDMPEEIGEVDFVLFAVKLWDTAEAGEACRPLVGSKTAVVSLQNGVEAEEILSEFLGFRQVMAGVAEISSLIVAPGHLRKVSSIQMIRFGELDNQRSTRASALGRALHEAGVEVDHATDIWAAKWDKFIFLTGLSAMTALTRLPIGAARDDPDTRELLREVMLEVFRVARAKGVRLDEHTVANRMDFIDKINSDIRASMALDLESGRRLELPWLSGAVVRFGAETGVPTPVNNFVNAALKLHKNGSRAVPDGL